MCLIALAFDAHARYPFVLAANRDEYFERPAAGLDWWQPPDGGPEMLGGRDLRGGGTWLGMTAAGRLAMVTNMRTGQAPDAAAPTRGGMVVRWLRGDVEPSRFWMDVGLAGYNPFNLVAIDFPALLAFWVGASGTPSRLGRGIHGVSNAALNTPWPKVERLKRQVQQALLYGATAEDLFGRLFDALSDRQLAPDALLPATGIPLERERALSSAFIHLPGFGYGTRTSTVLVTEIVHRQRVTHVLERTFDAAGALASMRRTTLPDWPPLPDAAAPLPARQPIQEWRRPPL